MKASEARAIFEKNKRNIEFVYELIKGAAEYGANFVNIPDPIDDTIIMQLVNNGYTVGITQDPFGIEITKIKW